MGDNKVNYYTFLEMLAELNQFILEDYDPEYILDVRAIGGFSMIIHKRLLSFVQAGCHRMMAACLFLSA